MGLFKRTSNRSNAPPRSRWKRCLRASLLLFVSLLVLSPVLLGRTPLRNWLLARAVPQLQGRIHIGGASLWWFSAPVLTDIEVRDSAGRILLRVPRLESSKSLVALLCHPFDLGEFRLTQPAVHVVCSGSSTNLEAALAYWLQKKEVPSDFGFALDGIAVRAVLRQASVVLEDEDSGRKWSLDPLDLTVSIPRDRRTPLRVELNAAAADAQRSGRLRADVSAHFVPTDGGAVRLRAEGELHADELPLAAVEPFLRRLHPRIKLDGRLNAQLKLRPSDGQPGSPDVRLEGSASVQALALSDPLLGSDVLRLPRVEAPCRIALDGSRLTIEQLEIQSEIGKASLAGTMDVAKDPRYALLQPGHRIEAEVNLARLAGLLPNTLHLTKDTLIQAGTLSLHLHSTVRGDALLWQGDLHTSDLEGLYRGQRLTWKEPFAVVLTAHQEASDPLPVFEHIRCDSDFLRLDMSGSREEWTARGNFNLGRLSEHLSGFVELGSLRVAGEGTLRTTARRNPRGGYRLESDVRVAQLNVADGMRAWHEDTITLRVDLLGDPTGGYRLNAGALHALADKDGIDLDLLEPITDLQAFRAARARLRLHGDLARWQGRLTSLTGLLDGVRAAGQIDVDARLRYEAETIQLEDVKIVGRTVRFQGFGLCVDEPSLDFTTSGRWLPPRATLELQHTRLSCPTATLQAPAVTLGMDRVGAWQITASATVQGDLARLLSVSGLRGGQAGGAVAGRIDLRPDDGRQLVQLDVNVQNLVCGSPAAPFWRESRVNLTGHGVYDIVQDSLRIVQFHLDSPTLTCDAAGQVSALSSDRVLSLKGKLGRVPLTPALCAGAVGYALPALADVAQANGEISLDVQSGQVPLTEPMRAEVAGWLTLHSAQVSAGPLVRELSVLLKGPATLTLAKDHVVPFRLVNGRVYHTGLELHFPELTIRTSGSVGLDGSLSLTAEMPVPPKWLGSSKLAPVAAGQTIRLPIAGTLHKPKIDEQALRAASARFARDAAESVIRQQTNGELKKEAEKGLRKLFRSTNRKNH